MLYCAVTYPLGDDLQLGISYAGCSCSHAARERCKMACMMSCVLSVARGDGGKIYPGSRQFGIHLNIFVFFVFFVDKMIFLN